MKRFLVLALVLLVTLSCKGQPDPKIERIVGGPCEDCEATLDYKKLNLNPTPIDTLKGFEENEPKIKITGTVFENDGKTPAENILLYVYHVDRNGIYQPTSEPIGWERRHGQHRGWLKTDGEGNFTFYTFRPAPYPAVREPEHIHIYVKEPTTIPYYLDSYLFEDDPTLTREIKESQLNRGGSGLIQLEMEDGILTAHRDIVLGLNIPEYD